MQDKTLPPRPDLDHLKGQARALKDACRDGDPSALGRVQARHPGGARGPAPDAMTLSDAQLVVAREYGFPSWPQLKHHVETVRLDFAGKVDAFLQAACGGNLPRARYLLERHPEIGTTNILTETVLGDAEAVERRLARDPGLATRKTGPREAEPLSYAAFSRFHVEADRGAGIVRIARLLLDRGADPNGYWIDRQWPESKLRAIYGATGEADHPALARILLAAGADPNDGESVYHAAEHFHEGSLEVLAEFNANLSGPFQPWNNTPLYFLMGYSPASGNYGTATKGIRWLLTHGADPNVPSYDSRETPLHAAIRQGHPAELVGLLLAHGARADAEDRDGTTPLDLAVRYGREDIEPLLRGRGGRTREDPFARFLGACGRGDADRARACLRERGDLLATLPERDRSRIVEEAKAGRAEAVRTMLDVGFDIAARGTQGETALHQAAFFGQVGLVRLLIERGAPLESRDPSFQGTPMGWACHGSSHGGNPAGDYVGVVRSLAGAGAAITDANIANAAEEVAEALRALRKP